MHLKAMHCDKKRAIEAMYCGKKKDAEFCPTEWIRTAALAWSLQASLAATEKMMCVCLKTNKA